MRNHEQRQTFQCPSETVQTRRDAGLCRDISASSTVYAVAVGIHWLLSANTLLSAL